MRSRDKITLFLSIALAVVLLAAAGMQLDYINAKRRDMKLIINEAPENAPPSLAFATVAMGAFRGLVVDILWMRADRLKEEGQYFDARQLAEWITTLQPRFAAVWEFHAWNMAYNISVAIPATEPDQRWRWVRNGYELLRDKGIPLNPKSIQLYRELARIFQHKLGAVSDDAHKYYKLQLAMAMEPLLGPADNDYFDALAKTPSDLYEIQKDPNVAALLADLKAAGEPFDDDRTFISSYLALRQNASTFDQAAADAIDKYRGTETLKKFDTFARAHELRNTWKLDPVLMRDLNKNHGPVDWGDPNNRFPLDWRHPDCHAIYWAVKGLRMLAQEESREVDADEINADRIVAHSLQDLFRNGKMFIYDIPVQVPQDDPTKPPLTRMAKEVFLRPDFRMFHAYNRSFMTILEKYENDEKASRAESLKNGHRNMLKDALFAFYQAGHKRQAQEILDLLRKLYPLPEFDVSLDTFAFRRFADELGTIEINAAKGQITSLLRETFFLYAMHQDEQVVAREKVAQDIYDYYIAEFPDEFRVNLPEMSVLRYLALVDFLRDGQFPPNLKDSLLNRIQIERPDVYKQIEEQFEKQAEARKEATADRSP